MEPVDHPDTPVPIIWIGCSRRCSPTPSPSAGSAPSAESAPTGSSSPQNATYATCSTSTSPITTPGAATKATECFCVPPKTYRTDPVRCQNRQDPTPTASGRTAQRVPARRMKVQARTGNRVFDQHRRHPGQHHRRPHRLSRQRGDLPPARRRRPRAGQIDSHDRGQPALLPERGAAFRPLECAGRRQVPCLDPGRRRRPDLPDIGRRGPRPPAPRRDNTTGSLAAGTSPCLPRPSRPRVPGSQGIPARHRRQLMSHAKVGTVGPVNGRSHKRADRYR